MTVYDQRDPVSDQQVCVADQGVSRTNNRRESKCSGGVA